MISRLRRFYYGSATGRFLLGFGRKMYHLYKFRMISDESFIKWQFKQAFGRVPDLRNPKTLNEKIQWLKLHDRTPLHTQCADKYAVREYVTKKVGDEYLVPLLYHTLNPADIRPENLPDAPFIVKATHDSGGGTIVRTKEDLDWRAIQGVLRRRLRTNYYYAKKEWPYKNIPPRIVVERLLVDDAGNIPLDYKLHCFHGEPHVVQVDVDRFTDHKRNLYSTDWDLLPFTWCAWKDGEPLWPNGREVARPRQLETMLSVSRALSAPFMYARIDLYAVNDNVYFGEITFHHGSGTEIFSPCEWDRRLGDMLILPDEKRSADDNR